jgi:hypothetical protein
MGIPLPHVLWIGGPPGVGKTTVARLIARRHGLRWYNADAHTWEHRDRALAAGHPAAVRWEAMPRAQRWLVPPAEMLAMSLHHERGQMIVDDLRALPTTPLIIAEGTPVTPAVAGTGSRAVWLLPSLELQQARLAERNLPRGVHQLYQLLAQEIEAQVAEHGAGKLVIDGRRSVAETVAEVETFFARALDEGPAATTAVERRQLLRYANRAIVSQHLAFFARPWRPGTQVRPCTRSPVNAARPAVRNRSSSPSPISPSRPMRLPRQFWPPVTVPGVGDWCASVYPGDRTESSLLCRGGPAVARRTAARCSAAWLGIRCPRVRHSTIHGPRLGAPPTALCRAGGGRRRPRSRGCRPSQSFRGWPVRYGWDEVPVAHHVTVTTLTHWLTDHLGVDATSGMSPLDWLLTPQQKLLGVVGGAVYADDAGAVGLVRTQLAWYPDEIWRWLLACQWRRLAQEEAFVSRTAEVGDEIGSSLVAARLARDIIRLALLLARQYAPYGKWLGTAFVRLPHPDHVDQHVARAVHATSIDEREAALCDAYSALAHRHNAIGLTELLDTSIRLFHGRPARILGADRFVDACLAEVTSPELRRLPLGRRGRSIRRLH